METIVACKEGADKAFGQKKYKDAIVLYSKALQRIEKTEAFPRVIVPLIDALKAHHSVQFDQQAIRHAVPDTSRVFVFCRDSLPNQRFEEVKWHATLFIDRAEDAKTYELFYKSLINRSKSYYQAGAEGYALMDLYAAGPLVRLKDVWHAATICNRLHADLILSTIYIGLLKNMHVNSVAREVAAKKVNPVLMRVINLSSKPLHHVVNMRPENKPLSLDGQQLATLMPYITVLSSAQMAVRPQPQYVPPPLKGVAITDSPMHGLGMFATRGFANGQVIAQLQPYVMYNVREDVCQVCNKKGEVVCPKCGEETFCSQACLRHGRALYHDAICGPGLRGMQRYLREHGRTTSSRVQGLVLKLLAMARQQGLGSVFDLPLVQKLSAALPQHGRVLVESVYLPYRRTMHLLFRDHPKQEFWSFLSPEGYLLLRTCVMLNCFERSSPPECGNDTDEFGASGGAALYDAFTFINHSCIPSASLQNNCCLVARSAIQAGDEVTISYIAFDASVERRHEMLEQYGFQCRCMLCMLVQK